MGTKALMSATFGKKLTSLRVLRQQIHKGHLVLASAYIQFAEQFISLLDEAKQQDKANGTQTHQEAVRELGTLDGSQLNKSTEAKWRKIANKAQELKRNQKYLPSSRDALYFIAQGVENGIKLSALGSKGALSAESTLTDIKKLLTNDKRKAKGKTAAKRGGREDGATINMGTEIHAVRPIPLDLDVDRLPSDAQKLLSKNAVLLKVEQRIDPDTNRSTLVVIGYGQ